MNEIYHTTERRGFVWQCAVDDHKERKYRGNQDKPDKVPCGHWNAYYGRKWHEVRESPRWTGKCVNCGRKRQLNRGKIFPESPRYYEDRMKAIRAAIERNDQREHQMAIKSDIEGDLL
jgi:hypothetical protein